MYFFIANNKAGGGVYLQYVVLCIYGSVHLDKSSRAEKSFSTNTVGLAHTDNLKFKGSVSQDLCDPFLKIKTLYSTWAPYKKSITESRNFRYHEYFRSQIKTFLPPKKGKCFCDTVFMKKLYKLMSCKFTKL